MSTAEIEWETINQGTDVSLQRSRTPTGWLVREYSNVMHNIPDQGLVGGWDWRTSITFVPDPDGIWLKEPEPKGRYE